MTDVEPHRRDRLDIIVWLERQAMVAVNAEGRESVTAHRLREAAAEIRTARADRVSARLGKPQLLPKKKV